jgi:FkbM family methyltransferase
MNPENQPFVISHAQNREDIILSGFFKGVKKGFYVDIGANDPSQDSVTKFFYENEWSGINIEPIPRLYKQLVSARPRDINLNIGISSEAGSMTFREYPTMHGLSTFAKNIQKGYDGLSKKEEKYKEFKEYEVAIETLQHVFEKNIAPNLEIDFMKVDVEGLEYEVLEGNDWEKFRPRVICIESNHMTKDWRPFLLDNRYKAVFFDGLNTYYIADEAKDAQKSFSYIETMLPTPVVDYRVVGILEYYKNARLEAEARNAEIHNQLHVAQHNLYVTQQELERAASVRGALKTLALRVNNSIEELIIPSKYRSVVTPKANGGAEVSVVESSDPEEIFKAIRRYDLSSLKNLNPPAHRFRFGLLHAYRGYVLGTLKRIARFSFRVISKIGQKGK